MDKYKVAIVDDDEVALENLSFELGKDARFFLKGTARNGKQGKKLIAKVQPDLLFLDVELPHMTGMELLQEIRDSVSWNMRIVFYTAYDKYMIRGRKINCVMRRFFPSSSVGDRPAPRGCTSTPDERKVTTI